MGMPDVGRAPVSSGAASRFIDRRTLLVGAAGALAAAGLSGPARAAGSATSLAARTGPGFDPDLARQLQQALHDALRDPSTQSPGAILHVQSPKLGRWTGVAGLGRVAPAEPMRPGDRFRAGSIVKMFVAVTVLQLSERGRLSLDARLPEVLPASVTGRVGNAADITVRMLLGHRAGIPDWDSPAIDEQVARDPAKVWTVGEYLDLAAAKPPLFAPGTSFSYSNTDYPLLGLIIEGITGRSWRHEVTRRGHPPTAPDPYGPARPRATIDQGPARTRLRRDRRQVGRCEPRPLVRRCRRWLRPGHHGRRPRAVPERAIRGPAVPPPRDAPADADHRAGGGRGRPGRLRARHRAARPARRPHAHRPPRRRRLPLLRRPPAPNRRDHRAGDERRGRPDAAAPPRGQRAHSNASVNHHERRETALVVGGARSPTYVASRRNCRPTKDSLHATKRHRSAGSPRRPTRSSLRLARSGLPAGWPSAASLGAGASPSTGRDSRPAPSAV